MSDIEKKIKELKLERERVLNSAFSSQDKALLVRDIDSALSKLYESICPF